MDLSKLLASRDDLVEQARLANLAYAYVTLQRCALVAQRAGLMGPVQLQLPDPESQRYWTSIVPLVGNASIYEEHFSDEDVAALGDAIALVLGVTIHEGTFRIEELEQEFMAPLARELQRAGVKLNSAESSPAESSTP